jgi:hypothetical protein
MWYLMVRDKAELIRHVLYQHKSMKWHDTVVSIKWNTMNTMEWGIIPGDCDYVMHL